jgi:hypothetical protein
VPSPTKAELREQLAEARKVNDGLVSELETTGRLAQAGLELAVLWLKDCPLPHRGGCQCHFCVAARAVVRLAGEAVP